MPPAFERLAAALDYPMTIVTAAAAEGDRAGCLVGFHTQCSLAPLRWLVCISKLNHTFDVAQRAAHLAVHFPAESHRELAELFGEETGDEVDKFDRCDWRPWPGDGLTPLLAGLDRLLVGRILHTVDGGDHTGFVIEPVDTAWSDDGPQLGFQSVRSMDPGHPPPE